MNREPCQKGCLKKAQRAMEVFAGLPAPQEILENPSREFLDLYVAARSALDIYLARLGSEAVNHDDPHIMERTFSSPSLHHGMSKLVTGWK